MVLFFRFLATSINLHIDDVIGTNDFYFNVELKLQMAFLAIVPKKLSQTIRLQCYGQFSKIIDFKRNFTMV